MRSRGESCGRGGVAQAEMTMNSEIGSVRIGDTVLERGVFLAPMAGFTDAAFRRICEELGAAATVTEMLSAKAICYGDKKTSELALIPRGSGPVSVQIFGHEGADIGGAVRRLLSGEFDDVMHERPMAIDINMGCPVKKIVTSGDGSALMLDPALCARLVAAAVANSGGLPVTVKIRAGFDAARVNAREVARAAVSGGASAVFVHGRTREQFYAPSSSNEVIARVREALPPEIPVIGNGDICEAADAIRMIRETGCDGVMIGRAALGDPWIFERIRALCDGSDAREVSLYERMAMARRLCREVCDRYGEERGVPMCRGRAGHFIRGGPGAAAIRGALFRAVTLAEIEGCLS